MAQGTKGTASMTATGTYVYTPHPDANGDDTFTFKANDGTSDSNVATITVTIEGTNDVPVAMPDTATTPEDTPVNIPVLANDPGAVDAPLSITIVLGPSSGTATPHPDGTVTYTPEANFSGLATFTYQVTDADEESSVLPATVTVTVTAVNDPPTPHAGTLIAVEDEPALGAVLATDPEGDAVTYSLATDGTKGHVVFTNPATGAYTYTPHPDANGDDTFTFRATDPSAAFSVGTVSVTITAVDDAPTANNDAATTDEDTAVTIDVLANDTGLGDTPLTVTYSSLDASEGEATVTAENKIDFTPALNRTDSVTFLYTVADADGDASSHQVVVTITPVNDAPVAVDATASFWEDGGAQAGDLEVVDADEGDSHVFAGGGTRPMGRWS